MLSIFKPQFSLTNQNTLPFENFKKLDCKFNISYFRDIGSKYFDGRKNYSIMGLNNCLSNVSGNWFPWDYLEASTCRYFVTMFIYMMNTFNGSVTFDVDKLDLGWWVNGTCLRNSCSI